MKKLAVFFPGIGYTVDKPLMHYSRRLAANAGFEILLLPYSGFPQKVKGDRSKMAESCRIALKQSEEMLAGTDFRAYDDILLIGKSIGTVAAAETAAQSAGQLAFTCCSTHRSKRPLPARSETQSPLRAVPIRG